MSIEVYLESYNDLSRRQFLKFLGVGAIGTTLLLLGCEKKFKRPPGEHPLGRIENLLYPEVVLPMKAFVVFMDEQGWSVMSIRCSYDGCGMSVQDDNITCPCCRSVFSKHGDVIYGPAESKLPWYQIVHADGVLFADSGEEVRRDYRFITDSVKQRMPDVLKLLEERRMHKAPPIPEALLGKPREEIGRMFVENNPDEVFEQRLDNELKTLKGRAKN